MNKWQLEAQTRDIERNLGNIGWYVAWLTGEVKTRVPNDGIYLRLDDIIKRIEQYERR